MSEHRATFVGSPTVQRSGYLRMLLIAGLGLVASLLTLALAVAGATETTNPQLALRFYPSDSIALAARAEQLLARQPERPGPEVKRLALASLRQQSLNPLALRLLGYIDTLEYREQSARSLMRLSEGQSRRDSGTQFWLVEDAVQRGDVKRALAHYDILLRTHPSTYTTLFPILVQALGDPAIREALVPYIRTDRNWAPLFLAHASANSADLGSLVDLMLKSGGLGDPVAARAQTVDLLQRLIARNMFADARRLYLGTRGNIASLLDTASFTAADPAASASPMAWQIRTEADAGGEFIDNGTARPMLSVFASAATTAAIASKILYLPPGRYRLAVALDRFEGDEGSLLRWQLRCPALPDKRPVWSIDSGNRPVTADLNIPERCTVQYLDLIGSGGQGSNGMSATVRSVSLTPIR